MKKGNWVPMDKALVKALPKKRAYSLVEAVFSYQIDRDQETVKAEREYARIWCWSRSKVRAFLHTNRVTTPDTGKRPVKFRFVEQIRDDKDQTTDQQPAQPETTTINPNPQSLNPYANNANNGGVRLLRQPHTTTFSFKELETKNTVDDEKAKAIDYYLRAYKRYVGREHPRLKLEQWVTVIDEILSVSDENGQIIEIDIADFKVIVDAHFDYDYQQPCDYNILHFVSGLIRIMRMRDLRMF